jgi:hypothetical protein
MALEVSQADGQWQLTGMTRNPATVAPLGRRYFQAGAHWIGFDDSFAEPVIVRAYFDPTTDESTHQLMDRGLLNYIGYLQFMRLSFRGMPIPPAVYGGRLADRQSYVYGDDLKFIDFMGPTDARLRGIKTPFYPFNAMLVNGNVREDDDFLYFPLENGCLCAPENLGTTQALAASLVGEIAPGLVTPEHIAPLLGDDNLLLTMAVTNTDLAQAEPYRIALDALENRPLPEAPDDPAPLRGLDESGVAAQVIGDYVLLTLPDPENFGDTLVVSTAPVQGGVNVLVHLLTDYDMEGLAGNAGREALWRINDYQLDEGFTSVDQMDVAPPAGRGSSGLLTPPYALNPDEFALELRYWTLAVGDRRIRTRGRPRWTLLSCIEWAALFQFDEDTGVMSLAAIREPMPALFDVTAGLDAYGRAYASATGAIDVSNFTKAAMRRDNFAAGAKLSFVDLSNVPLT